MGAALEQMRFLIHDRASQITITFDAVFEDCGLRILRSPHQAPRANAICERRIDALRSELLNYILILNETHLHTVLTKYTAHYNTGRPHQGIAQQIPDNDQNPLNAKIIDLDTARIHRRATLNNTNEYK